MIPNVFISSTISDLGYLRDALADAVREMEFVPVMSERGGVGYISPTSAVESCYKTIQQCQLAVIIIGRRYNSFADGQLSVTHQEFLSAQKHQIPTITFVEARVLHYKDVFTADPDAATWEKFPEMDEPRRTFSFLDDVNSSKIFNAILPITSASEAKRLLKRQIASFVGESLSGLISPVRSEVQDVLAELKTLRRDLQPDNRESQTYLHAFRFLLDDQRAGLRKFCEELTGDLDTSVDLLLKHETLDSAFAELNLSLKVDHEHDSYEAVLKDTPGFKLRYASQSGDLWWAIGAKEVVLSPYQHERFKSMHRQMRKT